MASIWDSGGTGVSHALGIKRQSWELVAPTDTFNISEFTYTPGANQLLVLVNGAYQDLALGDYVEVSPGIVRLTFTPSIGERVVIIGLGVE